MCGIAGMAAAGSPGSPDERVLWEMCRTLAHRGPDDEAVEVADGVGLAIRRLAVIDVEGGSQPYHNETGRVRAVFNGEIYNFRELRRDLERRGHRFRTRADGEVLVHLWEELGVDLLPRLNGMFALAVHDLDRRTLLLARDRLGIKPLYYSLGEEGVAFGSEVKAVLASGLVERRLDLDALGEFLSWEYVPAPRTLLHGVRKLEAGGRLLLDLSGSRPDGETRRWWDVPASATDDERPVEEWVEAVDETLARAVRRQLVSDVPLGAFLSGGVDSSLVVAHMGETRAYTIGFDEPSYSEVAWAERVARHLGVEHRVAILEPRAVELFDRLMCQMDDPIGDFSIFPTYLVSRHARDEVTVALSGDGGDELFGGYETYAAQRVARLWRRLPGFVRRGLEGRIASLKPRPEKKGLANKARRFAEGLAHDEGLRHARWRLFLGEETRRLLFTEDALAAQTATPSDHVLRLFDDSGARPDLDRELYVDVRSYLTDNCLVKVDRMSMACSLEVRVPMLDHELVELAFRVPPRLKVKGRRTKPLLKRCAARHVPAECAYRPKEGFSIPMKHWLGAEFRPLLEELLDPADLAAEGVFRPETVERLRKEHLSREANHSHLLWALLVFRDWRRRWRV